MIGGDTVCDDCSCPVDYPDTVECCGEVRCLDCNDGHYEDKHPIGKRGALVSISNEERDRLTLRAGDTYKGFGIGFVVACAVWIATLLGSDPGHPPPCPRQHCADTEVWPHYLQAEKALHGPTVKERSK